jgi:hypothetical protein
VDVSSLFRSNYIGKCLDEPDMLESTLPDSPSTQLYTMIRLDMAAAIFLAFYLAYAIILLLIKKCISKDFLLFSYAKRFQHIIEALNMPESFADWDSEHNLDIQAKLYPKYYKNSNETCNFAVLGQIGKISTFLLNYPTFEAKWIQNLICRTF